MLQNVKASNDRWTKCLLSSISSQIADTVICHFEDSFQTAAETRVDNYDDKEPSKNVWSNIEKWISEMTRRRQSQLSDISHLTKTLTYSAVRRSDQPWISTDPTQLICRRCLATTSPASCSSSSRQYCCMSEWAFAGRQTWRASG